jgi:WD40 repeat protein
MWAWDVETGEPVIDDSDIGNLLGVTTVQGQIAFKLLASDEQRRRFGIVDAHSGALRWSHEAMPGRILLREEVNLVTTEVDKKLFVGGCTPGIVTVWSPDGLFGLLSTLQFGVAPLRSAALGYVDGRLVVATAPDYEGSAFVHLQEVSSNPADPADRVGAWPAKALPIWSLSAGPDNSVVAVAGDEELEVLSVGPDGDIVYDPGVDSETINALLYGALDVGERFKSDEHGTRFVGSGHPWHTRRPWTGVRRLRRDDPSAWPTTAACRGVVSGRPVIALGSYGGAVWVWDINSRAVMAGPFADVPDELAVAGPDVKGARPSEVTGLAIGRMGERDVLATACNGRVALWDVGNTHSLEPPATGAVKVVSVALGTMKGRDVLITGSEGGVLGVWDAADPKRERLAGITLDTPIKGTWAVRGADIVAAHTPDFNLHLFDVAAGGRPPG